MNFIETLIVSGVMLVGGQVLTYLLGARRNRSEINKANADAAESLTASAMKLIQPLEERIKVLEQKVVERDARIEVLETLVRRRDARIVDLESRVSELEAREKELVMENKRLKAQMEKGVT